MNLSKLGVQSSYQQGLNINQSSNNKSNNISNNELQEQTDRISISEKSKSLVSNNGIPEWASNLSNKLHNNTDKEDVFNTVKNFAFSKDYQIVSLSKNSDGINGVFYKNSNVAVTKESQKVFNEESEKVQKGKIDIFNSETAKGTNPADIFDKIQDYLSKQNQDYLSKINWYG